MTNRVRSGRQKVAPEAKKGRENREFDKGENREFVDPTEFRVASQSYRLPLDTERRGSLVKSDELVLALAAVQRQEILAQEPEGLVLSIVSGGHRVVVWAARRRHLAALNSLVGASVDRAFFKLCCGAAHDPSPRA